MNIQVDFGLTDEDVKHIKAVLQSVSMVNKAVLFGSRAMGNYKPGSDVDLALFTIDPKAATHVSGLLNDSSPMPYKFDVLDVADIQNTDLLDHIARVGIIIFEREIA
jgi:predicted nucleotidyltransferase